MSTRSISESSATYLPNAEDRRQLIDIKESLSALQEETQQLLDKQFDAMAAQNDFPVAMLKVPLPTVR